MGDIRYLKFCIICQKKYHARKVNSTFCSKKCANRARYIPKDMIVKLVNRNNEFTIETTDLNNTGKVTISTAMSMKTQLALAREAAEKLAEQRGIFKRIPTVAERLKEKELEEKAQQELNILADNLPLAEEIIDDYDPVLQGAKNEPSVECIQGVLSQEAITTTPESSEETQNTNKPSNIWSNSNGIRSIGSDRNNHSSNPTSVGTVKSGIRKLG